MSVNECDEVADRVWHRRSDLLGKRCLERGLCEPVHRKADTQYNRRVLATITYLRS
jgi:hypothetical protein